MPTRVQNAADLGLVLQDQPRADSPDHAPVRKAIDAWRAAAQAARRAAPKAPSPAPDGAGQPLQLQDFQHDFAKFALALRQGGLPPGQP
jgi:hypothetical protein